MEKTIKTKLLDIEKQYGISVLFSCESGSRAWGFPSPDSDYDVRFIYVHSLEHYLSVYKKTDQISFPITDNLDICGWDISKVLQLISKSNTTPFEWLQSPVVYWDNVMFREELWALCQHYFCARQNAHHYMGIAKGAMETMQGEDIKIKKLFYVLRPLLAALWNVDHNSIAPMDIHLLMQLLPNSLHKKVLSLIDLKSGAAEGHLIKMEPDIKQWINDTYSYCEKKSGKLERKDFDKNIVDNFFRKTIFE
jgi:predicted nucleotidyltransferase